MLMDHTTSSPLIPQLDMSASANPSKIASQVASGSSGVVYPATTQQYNQKLEEAAQVKAMAEKTYGPPSYPIHRDRKMQQYVDGPAGTTPEQMKQMSDAAQKDFMSDDNGNIFHDYAWPISMAGVAIAALIGGLVWFTNCRDSHKESAAERAATARDMAVARGGK
ncbi:uncharacterized protein MELLADRAFT_91634 [Melampsora larici-populina 98AG31]|uniref:Uncharacterized protein n=1 Tax=Melampsora larici-populina (strain 98AG31 / pathotype 3-4-7) TaxID=747676 RepID=F4RZR8_MELLP|nr:uncharacterized protein MELLADRAFT_91634 [Melampsora larici-populina 98AG31]EGG02050.1 hypothetical protein MELLADRAFT_91634 [Melampsora larici-populina 98AG31]